VNVVLYITKIVCDLYYVVNLTVWAGINSIM